MDGSGSAGNPSAASSRSLPAHTDEDMLQPADWISASEDDGQGRDEISLPGSQKHQRPAEKHQRPAKKHQSPAKKHQSPAEKHQSPTKKHQSPAEKHQRPANTQQTVEEPDQLHLPEHINHEDPSVEKQKPEDSPTEQDQLKPNPLPTEEQKLGNSPLKEKKKTEDSSETDQLKPEKTSPAKPANSPFPKEQPKPDQPSPTKLDSLLTDQKKPGDPFCTKHEQKPDNSQDHQTQEDLCLTNQQTEEDPPPPLEDLTVFTSALDKQDQKELKLHISESKDQQNHWDPPPEELTSTTPERHQDPPPPPHLTTQQTPPPPADQQNHLSSPQVLPSIVRLTEASTLAPPVQAPPLTIEVFCDQVRPCPPVSSSGEPKLCGFLQKQGGPLRAWKQRWFTYEEKKNQLFYYRTPQDVTPLGRVELCSATFTYPLKAERGTFHIKTPERTFILKVGGHMSHPL